MMVKKYKKPKEPLGDIEEGAGAALTIKEPFLYEETPAFTTPNNSYKKLADLNYIFPFGYFAEQFLQLTKTNVYQSIL